jgi:hypothetical protein
LNSKGKQGNWANTVAVATHDYTFSRLAELCTEQGELSLWILHLNTISGDNETHEIVK